MTARTRTRRNDLHAAAATAKALGYRTLSGLVAAAVEQGKLIRTGDFLARIGGSDLPIREARTVAGSLRKNANKAGVTGTPGTSYAKNTKARTCTRYTRSEVAAIAVVYRPRKPAYKVVAAKLALAA